jgi:hypothetical protein
LVETGSTPLQPTSATQLKAHHGQRGGIQAFLANFGNQIDIAKGQTTQRPPARWQQHNCLPWRSDHCKSGLHTGSSNTNLGRSSRSPTVPLTQHTSPHPYSHTQTIHRHPSGSDIDRTFNEELYSTSFRRPRIHGAPESSVTLTPVDVATLEQRLKDKLFIPFLDDWNALPESQRRDQVLGTLKEHLQTPIMVSIPTYDRDNCEEFVRIKNTMEISLEIMCIRGISFFPDLINNGRALEIHVLED